MSNGCEYCNDEANLYYTEDRGMWGYIGIFNGYLTADLIDDYASVEIHYCPMCGRKLVEESDATI